MSLYEIVRNQILHGHNPYSGFPVKEWAGTWYNDPGATRPIFKQSLEKVRPNLAIELGSFVGESSIHIAKIMRELNPKSVLICVDTWMGGIDHWIKVPEKLRFHFGRSSLYYQFIGNVMAHHCEDIILPLSFDSVNAARLLKHLGIYADWIYSDASHEEGDVLRDYESYWELLRSGGLMLCDDWSNHFPPVIIDGDKFLAKHNIKPIAIEGEKVLLQKP